MVRKDNTRLENSQCVYLEIVDAKERQHFCSLPPEESDETISLSFFVVITGVFVILNFQKMLLH